MTEPAPEVGEVSRPGQTAAETRRDAVWHPREASAAESAARYSRFVAVMKVALPAAAGFLLLLVVVLPQFRGDDERFRIGMELVRGSNTDTLSMTNARYSGTDDQGQPYSVLADGVRQQSSDKRAIDLVAPKAEISLVDGRFLSASAAAGTYDRDTQTLDLTGDVTVAQDKGNQLRTGSARVLLKEGAASGREQVSGEGPFGTLRAAGGFDLSERGKIVYFHGPAQLTINPAAKPASGAATPPSSPTVNSETGAGRKP